MEYEAAMSVYCVQRRIQRGSLTSRGGGVGTLHPSSIQTEATSTQVYLSTYTVLVVARPISSNTVQNKSTGMKKSCHAMLGSFFQVKTGLHYSRADW